MRNKIAIGFLFIYLFSVTEFNELLKIPFLISHYAEHTANSFDFSVIEFFVEHYGSDDSNDKAHHRLPFKNHVDISLFTALKIIPYNLNIELKAPFNQVEKNLRFSALINYSLILKEDKWRPPRV